MCNGIRQIGETKFFNSVGPRWFRRKPNPKNLNLIYSTDYFGWIGLFQSWQESIRVQCARNQMWIAQRSSPYPSAAMNSLRQQRWGWIPLTAAETSDRRRLATRRRSGDLRWQSELLRGRRGSEKFPKFCPCLYIARPCRCDRVEQLGGTEMHNCVQLQQLGVTEKFKSVAPRLKTQINLMILVGPKWRNRSDRESQRGFGSLSL